MTTSLSLTKTLALAMVSHLAITTASFSGENTELSDAIDLAPLTKTVEQVQEQNLGNSNNIVELIKAEDSVIIDLESQLPTQPLTASQILTNKGEEASKGFQVLDTAIKYGIVTAAIGTGAGLAWFYGPALAFGAAYYTSIKLATLAATPTAWAYYFVIKPAAVDAGIYFATSSLVQTAIGAVGAGLGYGLGKVGCATYEGLKYTVGTGIPTATTFAAKTTYSVASTVGKATYDAGAYLAPKIGNAAYTVGSKAVSTTGSVLSSVANTTSNLVSSAWNWWSGSKTTTSLTTAEIAV